jgi:hypothetical protein
VGSTWSSTAASVSKPPDMPNPLWLDDLFGGLMVSVTVYSVARLIASRMWSRPTHRDVDVAHVLMGSSMAGQLVSDLNPIPSGVWELVFSVLAVWFLRRCYEFVRDPGTDSRFDDHAHRLARRVIHLMMALAMLYMYLAAVPARIGTGMAMGTPTGSATNFVLVPTLFVLVFLGSAVWTLDGIGRFASEGRSALPSPVLLAVAGDSATDGETGAGRGISVALPSAGREVGLREEPAWLAPRLEEGAHIVMVVTMAYMLVLML